MAWGSLRLIGRWVSRLRRAERERPCHPSAAVAALPRAAWLWAVRLAATRLRAGIAALSLLAAGVLSGCVGCSGESKAVAPAGNVIIVSAAACGTGWRHPAAGVQTLQIHNASTAAVEVALTDAGTGAVYAGWRGSGQARPGRCRSTWGPAGTLSCAPAVDYGDRVGPTIQVPGHVRGGAAILPADAQAQ